MRTIFRTTLLLFSAAVLAGGAAAVRGQSALDGFDPNANAPVNVAVVQPDGKVLIGGSFTSVLGVTRNRIARLNPDGTLDTAFNPNANDIVYSIAVQADGKILAGGDFNGTNSIGGQTRNRIARLDPTTGLADSFDPGANLLVFSIAVQADGRVLAGGDFTTMGGQTRNHIARLNADGTLDAAFNPNANGFVASIVVQADGKILAGGDFSGANSIGGQTRNFIARLDASTGLADSFNPNANLFVRTIAVQADGKILAGGYFNGANSIGGQVRNRIARLDPTTGLADSFNPNANNIVRSIVVQTDGRILVGGFFSGANSLGGATRNFIARLDATTGLADSFDPNSNGAVIAIAVQADGKILAGGNFNALAPNGGAMVDRNNIARLEADGRADQTLNLSTVGNFVNATAVQSDGQVVIGGLFTSVLGVPRNNMARLNTDGTLDTAFNPNANGDVRAIAVQADGKILAGGAFTNIGGLTRNRIARLATTGLADSFNPNANGNVFSISVQADGKILAGGNFFGAVSIGGQKRNFIARLDATTGLADSFNPDANSVVYAIAVQTNGKILVGGNFFGTNSIGGQTRNGIARLDGTTALADSFDPDANNDVFSIAVQADGKILAGGNFNGASSIGGQPRNHIARLDATTGLADSFDPNANDVVLSIAVQADGKILAGGTFNGASSIGGQTRNRIARLDATTGLADSFDPDANNDVFSIAVQADGKILAGGDFTSMGGEPRSLFARLTNDAPALQNLAVTQTSITWTRGGSSPQFARVTFESSTDSVNYSLLGNGIPQSGSSNWTLAGLNFPTGQNIYVRARGFYRGGRYNDSESLTESVRNAFIAGPTPTATPTATPTPTATATSTPTATATSTPTATATSTPTATATSTPTATATSTPTATATSTPTATATSTPTATATSTPTATATSTPTATATSTPTATATSTPTATATSTSTPTATATSTPTATATATPTVAPIVSISGTVFYCPNPAVPTHPVPGVTMTLSGTASAVTTTDANGNYTFTGLASGGSYTVTPTRPALVPGTSGINTSDSIAVQRHFLNVVLLTGCRLTAGDVNIPPNGVNTSDAIAVQRFFLNQTSGLAQTGTYVFSPVNRSYSPLVSDQTGQNFDALILGDVATGFVFRPEGEPLPDANTSEVASTVGAVALPEVTVDQSRRTSSPR